MEMCKEHSGHEQRLRAHEARIKNLEEDTVDLKAIIVRLDGIIANTSDHEERIRHLEAKDGVLWQHVIKYAMTAGVAALITWLATQPAILH